MQIVEMRVHMDCPGCERKISKALSKLDGVDNIDIDMNMQKVTVTGWAKQDKVLKAVRKTGRAAELWPFPYNPEYHDYAYHYYGQNYASNNSTRGGYYSNYYGYNSGFNGSNYDHDYHHHMTEPVSKYNYHKHGYNGHEHGYYQSPPSSTIFNERATTMFSDDNTTGCYIM